MKSVIPFQMPRLLVRFSSCCLIISIFIAGCDDKDREPALEKGTYSLTTEGSYNIKAKAVKSAEFRKARPSDTGALVPSGYDPTKDEVLWLQLNGQSTQKLDSLTVGIFLEDGQLRTGSYSAKAFNPDSVGSFQEQTLAYIWLNDERGLIGAKSGTIKLTRITENLVEGKISKLRFGPGFWYQGDKAFRVEAEFKAEREPTLYPKTIALTP